MCATMWKMLLGVEERVMIVVTPAEVARRAAVSLVDIPPVPRLEPADETARMLEDPLNGGKYKPTIHFEARDVLHNLDRLRFRMRPGVIGVETIHIGHQEQIVGIDHPRREG